MTEEWRSVVGWEGIYDVSSIGRVRRMRQCNRSYAGRILKNSKSRKGYLIVRLMADGRDFRRTVHSLVAEAFIGPRPDGYQVNHKDTNKQNNHFDNLEYTTCRENIEHAISHGLRADVRGEANGFSRLTEEDVREIRAAYSDGQTQSQIAARYKITQANVSEIVRRATWRHV